MVKLLRDFLLRPEVDQESNTTAEQREQHSQCTTARTAKLLFANKTETDIWWKDELRQVSKAESERWVLTCLLTTTTDDY